MSWTYRVFKHTYEDGEVQYAIHEHYTTNAGQTTWTNDPIEVVGEDKASVKWQLEQMSKALDKPVLDYATGLEVES